MQELLLVTGPAGSIDWCPDFYTGPGPQCMKYDPDDDAGFFGEVDSSDFITPDELTKIALVTTGTAINPNVTWLKFWLDGRVLFVAKKPIRYSVSYDQLNNLGLITGSKYFELDNRMCSIKLLGGLDPNLEVPASPGVDNEPTWNSEWNRLIYRVVEPILPTYPKTSQTGDNWANYPQNDTVNGIGPVTGTASYSWAKEIHPDTAGQATTRGYDSVTRLQNHPSNATTSTLGWRPCIEYSLEESPPDLTLAYRYLPEDYYDDDYFFAGPDRLALAIWPRKIILETNI